MQNAQVSIPAAAIARHGGARSTSDRDLLDCIAAGDRKAMRTLYNRHSVRVYRYVLRLTGDAARSEEIVSEVFFNVWRHAARFEGRSQVSTWILAIARHKTITALRRPREQPLDDTVAESIVDPADNPQTALEKKDTGNLLWCCLTRLSVEHREIIDLVYYHGKSVDEAAEIVGVPRNTVKTRMFYARRRIAEMIEDAGGRQSLQ
jgi:RNA polymerase sigma-70 factor (ECF subfamily)